MTRRLNIRQSWELRGRNQRYQLHLRSLLFCAAFVNQSSGSAAVATCFGSPSHEVKICRHYHELNFTLILYECCWQPLIRALEFFLIWFSSCNCRGLVALACPNQDTALLFGYLVSNVQKAIF